MVTNYILGKYTFYQRNFVSWTFFSNGNGLFLAKKLQEFILTKSVCELIDFDFDPVLTNLGGSDFADIEKVVIQGKNSYGLYHHYCLYKSEIQLKLFWSDTKFNYFIH